MQQRGFGVSNQKFIDDPHIPSNIQIPIINSIMQN